MPTRSKSERAQRALETRRENAERERQEGIRLAKETAGGRLAKRKAMANPVWMNEPKSGAAKQGGRKKARVQEQEDLIGDGEKGARNNSDDEALEFANEQPPKIKKKVVPKAVTKKPSAPDFEDSEDSESDSGDDAEEKSIERDGSEGDSEDEDDEGFEEEQDTYDARPMILDENEDDADAGVFEDSDHGTVRTIHSRPRTEIEDFDMDFGANKGDGERDPTPAVEPEAATARKRRRQLVDSSESDEENIPPAPTLPKKARLRVSESRREAFRAERPRVKKNYTPQSAARSSKKVNDNDWPDDVRLIPATKAPHKKRQLTEQTSLIQTIIRHAIDSATEDILLRNSWPEEKNRLAYGKKLALEACDDMEIRASYDAIKMMKKRLKVDNMFCKGVCDIVVDRLSSVRGEVKLEAFKHLTGYEVGLGEICKKRVQALLTDHRYHMIGRWGGEDGAEWIADRKTSFKNPVLIYTIKKAWFAKSHSVGYRFVEQFTSSVEGHPEEKEIPMTLLALAMTAIYCCLCGQADGDIKRVDFNATAFLEVNRSILNILNMRKESRPLDFHKRMHELYQQVVETHMIAANNADAEMSAANCIDF